MTGEGLGHTMRAQVVVPHLLAQGHTVKVAASGRARALFERLGWDVIPIDGLSIRYRDGAAQRLETVLETARRALPALRNNASRVLSDVLAFDPHLCLSDFDSFAYAAGRALGRPVISFDHHHVITRFHHPRPVLSRVSYDFALTRALVASKLPRCDRYVVSSFYFPRPRSAAANDTILVGPVVRDAVAELRPRRGDHVLVYQTAAGDPRLLRALDEARELQFRVYGLGARTPTRNASFLPFDEARFLEDLASARAVVTNGGFMTIAEALVLGKPVLACPVRHQGEQELNAAWLEHLGLGLRRRRVDADALRAVVEHPPPEPLAPGTRHALSAIDRAVAEVA